MKFTIESTEFKNITERAGVLSSKKGTTIFLTSIHLFADEKNNRVTVKATNFKSFSVVFSDHVEVSEGGDVYVETDMLKRLYAIGGRLTVESDENTLLVRGDKKQGQIAVVTEEAIEFPNVESEIAFSADKEDMLDTFSKLSCCIADAGVRPIQTGFNVAEICCRHRIAAVDSHKAVVREVDWAFRDDLNITVPGYITKELRKVSANKEQEIISVYADEKYAEFVGKDFVYTTRLLEGKFFDIDALFVPKEHTYAFCVGAETMYDVAKEYSGFLSKEGEPIFFLHKNGKLVSAAQTYRYCTSDVMDVESARDVPEDLIYCLNPHFLKELLSVFGKEKIRIESVSRSAQVSPWLIRGEGGYSGLILPVRPLDDMSKIEKLLACA